MRGRAAAAVALALAVAGLLVPAGLPAASGPLERPSYVGWKLADALRDLQGRGVSIIFSSDLVDDSMIVRYAPDGESLHEILVSLLGPHGLEPEIGPRGKVLVVRRESWPMVVRILEPSPGQAVFGRVEVVADVITDEAIARVDFLVDGEKVSSVLRPPYRTVVDLGEENVDRHFEVVALGAWGGRGSATLRTRRVEIEDSVEVALKQVYVTVERGDAQVRDLGRQHFVLFEDGQRRDLVTFERGEVPLAAILLLDASESMKGAPLEAALDGTESFLSSMGALDEVQVVLFSDQPLAATRFSNQPGVLLAGLSGLRARGGTALNDHLYASLRLLDRRQGRRVVLLLSDGADVLSTLRMHDVLWKVRRSDALIYWIRLGKGALGQFSSAWRDYAANDEERRGLEQAVRYSGGRIVDVDGVEQVEEAFGAVMQELRGQYVLGYYPPTESDSDDWHDVRVDVDAPGVKVRYRPGYFER
ncbi:MAG: VWA domain-containing protein [Thermoanaerobaculia bacterium]